MSGPGEAHLSEPRYHDVVITVAGGAGSATLKGSFWASYTVVDVPDGANWSLAVTDKDGKPVTGRALKTEDFVFIEEYPLKNETTFSITGASIDGTYRIRIWEARGV